MLVIAVIWFIPIYYLIVTTLKNPQEATANPLGLPIHLEIGNYIKAWTNMQFPRAFANTLFITATAVVIIVVFGAMAGYAIGHYLWQTPGGEFTAIADFFFRIIPGFTHTEYDKICAMYNQYNFWVVFTAGFSPIPYKLITITAGVFKIDFPVFLVASVVSRGLRFFLISWLIWKYGEPIKRFIDKYFNWLALVFTVLLIGGFFAIKHAF